MGALLFKAYDESMLDNAYEDENGETAMTITVNRPKFQALSTAMLASLLSQLTVFVAVSFFVALLVVAASVVPDFANGSGGVTAFTHPHVVYMVAPLLVYFAYTQTMYFSPYLNIDRFLKRQWVFLLFLGLDVQSHVTHLVFISLEIHYCDSDLCTDANSNLGKIFLIILLVFVCVWIVLDIVIFILTLRYRKYMKQAVKLGWRPGYISSEREVRELVPATAIYSKVDRQMRSRKGRKVVSVSRKNNVNWAMGTPKGSRPVAPLDAYKELIDEHKTR